jgi:hypothetical protein
MSARQGRPDGIVFFDSQKVVEPRSHRSWTAIVAVLLVSASLAAVGVWQLLLSR